MLYGLGKSFKPEKPPPKMPLAFLRPMLAVTVPVLKDAKIAKEFETEKIPLIVFSHGLTANRMQYSGLCREWASHGIMVAAIDHQDGSCVHTVDGNTGKTLKFDSEMSMVESAPRC